MRLGTFALSVVLLAGSAVAQPTPATLDAIRAEAPHQGPKIKKAHQSY